MSRLTLLVKRPNSLLSVLLRTEITEQQYGQIVLLLSNPDQYVVAKKPGIGFKSPEERTGNART